MVQVVVQALTLTAEALTKGVRGSTTGEDEEEQAEELGVRLARLEQDLAHMARNIQGFSESTTAAAEAAATKAAATKAAAEASSGESEAGKRAQLLQDRLDAMEQKLAAEVSE